ncbi:GvpL/GvpF family gas vesicle protein [Streptomyces racemochromogenes]|uniref:GvpL/GvpF family gas vesicle protein n=1 Tax=Streptomyces racemochromogenes TaxID=67353 RepID=A0ABW7PDT7_9ACTN
MSTYVYGIARAGQDLPDTLAGIGEPPLPVRAVRGGKLVALVSDAPAELRPKRRDLLAHQRVVIEAGGSGPVLPLRFGGVSPDDDTVSAVLTGRQERYLERLSELEGKDEFNVKVSHDEEAVLASVVGADAQLRARHQALREAGGGTHEEKLAFGEKVAGAVSARERADAALVEEALRPFVCALRHGPEGTGWLANLSFLVGREHREAFLEAVAALHERYDRLRVQVTGPLPAYSFAEVD